MSTLANNNDTSLTSSSVGGVPMAKAFGIYQLITMGIFGLCVCALVSISSQNEFERIRLKDQRQQISFISDTFKTILEEWTYILNDHSKFPLIIQTVMQPEL